MPAAPFEPIPVMITPRANDAPQRTQAIQSGHVDVESDNVGIEACDLFESDGRTRRSCDYFHVWFAADHSRQRRAHEGAVIYYQYANSRTIV